MRYGGSGTGTYGGIGNVVANPLFSGVATFTGGTVVTSQPVINATQTWNDAGVVFTGWKLNITDTASAENSYLAELQVGGVQKFGVTKTGQIITAAGIQTAAGTNINANGYFRVNSRGYLHGAADGVWTLYDEANSSFGRLQFGGTSASFPALKRSATALQCRLADDSDYAPFAASAYSVGTTAGLASFSGAVTNLTVVNGIVTAAS